MRLTEQQVAAIRRAVSADDDARGGDVDLLVVLPEPVERPAMLSAQLSAKISRHMHGRSVDVVLSAPNLTTTPVHEIAAQEGVTL
ncbi:nucleotidyltransferase domain-containing protein [Spiribacter roseus]|uniref:Nucleotidyltransferase domain-containing protein n=1 Tax=Spiribacter roseus TaxID=1855875 RepID=A0ABV3RX92_9GAMM